MRRLFFRPVPGPIVFRTAPAEQPLTSSSLALLSHLDMHSQAGLDSQGGDDARALQELEGLEDTGSWKEILVRPGRLDRREKRGTTATDSERVASSQGDCIDTGRGNEPKGIACVDGNSAAEASALRPRDSRLRTRSAGSSEERATSGRGKDFINMQSKDQKTVKGEADQDGEASSGQAEELRDQLVKNKKMRTKNQARRVDSLHDSRLEDSSRQEGTRAPRRKNEPPPSLDQRSESGSGKNNKRGDSERETGESRTREDFHLGRKHRARVASQREAEESVVERTEGDDHASRSSSERADRAPRRREHQEEREREYDDEEDAVFQAHFRVGLETEGARPLGLDREEILRNHVEQSRLGKSWNQVREQVSSPSEFRPESKLSLCFTSMQIHNSLHHLSVYRCLQLTPRNVHTHAYTRVYRGIY